MEAKLISKVKGKTAKCYFLTKDSELHIEPKMR